MSNFLNKILSDGFVKGEENILDKNDLNSLLINIEALISKQIRENKASPFLPLVGDNSELDFILEKILTNKYIKEKLELLLGKDYMMMAPTARISSKGDQGLELHQDAIGETGLLFLLTPQKKGSTVMLRSSHKFPGRIANYLSWNSKKLVNLISKISTDITGDSGDYYFWFHKTWHGRKKNIQKDEKEKYITLFFPFFPKKTNRDDVANENLPYIKKTNNEYLKNLMRLKDKNNHNIKIDLPVSLQIEKFDFKDFFNLNFNFFLIKLILLEIIFFPVRVLRLIKRLRN